MPRDPVLPTLGREGRDMMPRYLVGVYGGRVRSDELPHASERAPLAAAELTRQGIRACFQASISVPQARRVC
jgi:hypothetical protein